MILACYTVRVEFIFGLDRFICHAKCTNFIARLAYSEPFTGNKIVPSNFICTSKGDISAILQTAALQINVLGTLSIDQRIAKLEELLANNPDVAPRMEAAYEAYRGVLQEGI
jgi:hypothetical protein